VVLWRPFAPCLERPPVDQCLVKPVEIPLGSLALGPAEVVLRFGALDALAQIPKSVD
jgi:hypothetical protein